MLTKYFSRKYTCKYLGIHYMTLYKLAKNRKIKTKKIGNQTKYILDDYKIINEHKERKNICYCRVSSKKQKHDLDNQIKYMKKLYPNHEIISDIGSGLNYKRKGFIKIVDNMIEGIVETLILAHRDRFVRFGFEQYEYIMEKYSNGKIIILNESLTQNPLEEISKDILSIMNVYVARINGLRKYKNKNKIKNKN